MNMHKQTKQGSALCSDLALPYMSHLHTATDLLQPRRLGAPSSSRRQLG